MKQIIHGAIPLLFASPAFAEVCDKVRPRWEPTNGSINQFEELFFFFTSPIGIGLISVIAATLYVKKRWLSISCSVLVFLIAVLATIVWFWFGDDVVHAAHREGCLASPLVTIGALVLLSIWLFQYGRPRGIH